jgi:hypothetical protein
MQTMSSEDEPEKELEGLFAGIARTAVEEELLFSTGEDWHAS